MITPEQARALNPSDEAMAAKHEAHIDSFLENYDAWPVTYIIDCRGRVAQFLAERYKQAGWIVEVTTSSDLRNPGHVLKFTVPSSPTPGFGSGV